MKGSSRTVRVSKVRALEEKRAGGVSSQPGKRPTRSEYLNHWLTHIAARRPRPRTLDSYRTMVRRHIRPRGQTIEGES